MNFPLARWTCENSLSLALITACLQDESYDDVIGLLHYLEDTDGAVQSGRSHYIAVNLQVPHGVGVQRQSVQ